MFDIEDETEEIQISEDVDDEVEPVRVAADRGKPTARQIAEHEIPPLPVWAADKRRRTS